MKTNIYTETYEAVIDLIKDLSTIYDEKTLCTFKYYSVYTLEYNLSHTTVELQTITDILKSLEEKEYIEIITYANQTKSYIDWLAKYGQEGLSEKEYAEEIAKDYNPDYLIFILLKFKEEFCKTYTSELPDDLYFDENNNLVSDSENEKVMELKMIDTKIILNDLFVIANPRYDSENEKVFRYLLNNSNKDISKSVLKEELKLTNMKDLSKILENLNFKGDLKKIFFNVSKTAIKLINPISKDRLSQLNINRISLYPSKTTQE